MALGRMPDPRDPDGESVRRLYAELGDLGRHMERLAGRLDTVSDLAQDPQAVRALAEQVSALGERVHRLEVRVRGNGGGEASVLEMLGRMDERVRRLEAEDGKAEGSRGKIYQRLGDLERSDAASKASAAIWGSLAATIFTVLLNWLVQ